MDTGESNHRTSERASRSLLREPWVALAWLKAILGNYYCQIWRDSGFQRKRNHCQAVLKNRRAPRVRSSLDVRLSPVPPLSPPWRARKATQEGRGSPPLSPRPPGTVSWEGQGWDYWFTVMAGSWGGDSTGGVLRLEEAKPCSALCNPLVFPDSSL